MARDMTDAMRQAIKSSGKIVGEVVLRTPEGDQIMSSDDIVKAVGGTITTDETREIPGAGNIDILIDRASVDTVMPMGPRSPLSPVANNILYVRYRAEDDTDYTSYGAYDIADTDVVEAEAGIKLNLKIYDPSRRVQRFKFYRPYVYNRGYPYDDVWLSLLRSVLPFSEIEIVPTGQDVVALSWDVEDSRLRAVNDLALIMGYRIEWNHDGIGNVLIGPDTPSTADPVWEFVDGGNVKITEAQRRLSDEEAFNGVIITGESTGSDKPPVRAAAWDTDINSPTYFDPTKPEESSYGANPYFHTSPFAHNLTQAKAIAQSLLPKKLGLVERLEIECVLNPGVQVADPIQVERPDIGASGVYIVESTSIPLNSAAGRMSLTCRERRLFA